MDIRRFEAFDVNEALKMVKSELGPHAVILSSRTKSKSDGVFGLFSRPVVEVCAVPPKEVRKKGRRYQPQGRERDSENNNHDASKNSAVAMEPFIDGIEDIKKRLDGMLNNQANPDFALNSITGEVNELKSMVSHLLERSDTEKDFGLPKDFLVLKNILAERGVAPEYAQTIIDRLRDKNVSERSCDLKTLINATAGIMRDTMIFDGFIRKPDVDEKKPHVVAFVGPTGVGKTTTIAKIASHLSMNGAKVALVTIDTFRIAAVEQLRIYSKILSVPIEVVLSPHDLKRSIKIFSGMDIVLIDTAGRSQKDVAQISSLKHFLEADAGIDTRLVLSSSSQEKQMIETVKTFSPLGVSGLIFTKLDEAVGLGSIFNVNMKTGLPISYFTTGQSVPEDIEDGSAKGYLNKLFKTEKQNFQRKTAQ